MWAALHGFQFIRQDAEDLVKLLVSLLFVRDRPVQTPEHPQGEFGPDSLQQLRDRLPASCSISGTDTQSYLSQYNTRRFTSTSCQLNAPHAPINITNKYLQHY